MPDDKSVVRQKGKAEQKQQKKTKTHAPLQKRMVIIRKDSSMIYEIETKEGKKTIEGLMYSSVKDIHGETIREGDIIHVREYKNMVQELCEAAGGEYWIRMENRVKTMMLLMKLSQRKNSKEN